MRVGGKSDGRGEGVMVGRREVGVSVVVGQASVLGLGSNFQTIFDRRKTKKNS